MNTRRFTANLAFFVLTGEKLMITTAGKTRNVLPGNSVCRVSFVAAFSLATVGTLVGLIGKAEAVPITPGDFGPGVVVESFEGIVTSNPKFLLDGHVFPSGVTFNSGVSSGGLLDFAISPTGCFGSSGFASDVPDGTAFGCGNTLPGSSWDFTLPAPHEKVGLFATFTGDNTGTITLSAFDAFDNLVETVSIPAVPLSAWATNFLGLKNAGGISRIEVGSAISTGMVVDFLMFDIPIPAPIPEPSTFALAALGLLCFVVWRRRRRA